MWYTEWWLGGLTMMMVMMHKIKCMVIPKLCEVTNRAYRWEMFVCNTSCKATYSVRVLEMKKMDTGNQSNITRDTKLLQKRRDKA